MIILGVDCHASLHHPHIHCHSVALRHAESTSTGCDLVKNMAYGLQSQSLETNGNDCDRVDSYTSVEHPYTSVGDTYTSVEDPYTSIGDLYSSIGDHHYSIVGEPCSYNTGDPNTTTCSSAVNGIHCVAEPDDSDKIVTSINASYTRTC